MSEVCSAERFLLSLISGRVQSQTFKTMQPWQNYEPSDTSSLEAVSFFTQIENKQQQFTASLKMGIKSVSAVGKHLSHHWCSRTCTGLASGSLNHLFLSAVCRFSPWSALVTNVGTTKMYLKLSVKKPSELLCISQILMYSSTVLLQSCLINNVLLFRQLLFCRGLESSPKPAADLLFMTQAESSGPVLPIPCQLKGEHEISGKLVRPYGC